MPRLATFVCLVLAIGTAPTVGGAQAPVGQGPQVGQTPGPDGGGLAAARSNETARPTTVYTVRLLNRSKGGSTFGLAVRFAGLHASAAHRLFLDEARALRVRSTQGLAKETTRSGRRYWRLTGPVDSASMRLVFTTNRTDVIADQPRVRLAVLDVVVLTRRNGSVVANRSVRLAGPGVTAGTWAYLGEASIHPVAAGGRRVPVVVPDGVEPSLSADLVGRAMNRTRRLPGLPAPPATLSVWYRRRITETPEYTDEVVGTGGYDTIDLETAATAETVRHEYVHVTQRGDHAANATWFVEGSADYLAHLAGFYHANAGFDAFYAHVNVSSANASHRLGDERGVYTVGERVVGALDLRLRRSSNGTTTVADVIRFLNRHAGETVTLAEVADAVESLAGPADAAWLLRVVEGGRVPALPEPSETRSILAASRPGLDFDRDGLSNAAESDHATDPYARDTDGDELVDAREVRGPSDPTQRDTDGDGLSDSVDDQPATPTVWGTVEAVGAVTAALGVLSLWLTAGIGLLRFLDRFVGLLPARITGFRLRWLLVGNLGLVLLGLAIYGLATVAGDGTIA